MKTALVLLVLLVAGCSSSATSDTAPPDTTAPTAWIGMNPGDALAFDGPGGEVVLIYVDETYDVGADDYASATTWKHGDDYTTDYWIEDADGTLWWYGRKGEWRAGKDGEQPRKVPVTDGRATFGDRTITIGDDGPTEVETPDGTYKLTS